MKTTKVIVLMLGYLPVLLSPSRLFAQVKYDMTVSKDGTGSHTSIQAAFLAVPPNKTSRIVIFIKEGVYKENLTLDAQRKNVTLIGQNRDKVKLTFDNYSGKVVNGKTLSTSTSASTYILADGFCALNITFENSSGPVGQALAISITGDKTIFYNCNFLGRQDTYYAGTSRQFLWNCYLEGTTDFIFGPSTAWFDSCRLYSYGGSAFTAASTEAYVKYGYVFKNCTLSGAAGVSTMLGRPWRENASVGFLNCSLSACIKPEGWSNWGHPEYEKTARYFEYKNQGPGATPSKRVSWSKQITDLESEALTPLTVLKTTYANPPLVDNWNPLMTLSLYIPAPASVGGLLYPPRRAAFSSPEVQNFRLDGRILGSH